MSGLSGLAGRSALVTGGARGIGRAVVGRLLDEGALVTAVDVDAAALEGLAADLAGSALATATADVALEEDVARAVRAAADRWGPPELLVNNAGINAYYDAAAMTVAEWERLMAIDLRAAWLTARAVLPAMRAGGRGAIVNVSSIHAHATTPRMFPYAAAKAALLGLTRSLALDEGPHGIRVNAICPGFVRTRLVTEWLEQQDDPAAAERAVLDRHPLGRIGRPEEIAAMVCVLLSDEASFMTGATTFVDGGLGARMAC